MNQDRLALVLGGWLIKQALPELSMRRRIGMGLVLQQIHQALNFITRHADHLFGVAGSVFCGHGDTSLRWRYAIMLVYQCYF
ncbi:hypothetical protein EI533_26105 [Pseudomonas donghuensis]|nr:hypothetical protein [Pseudomonas donghuensis]